MFSTSLSKQRISSLEFIFSSVSFTLNLFLRESAIMMRFGRFSSTIIRNKCCEGMTIKMVIASFGKPDRRSVKKINKQVLQQWVYESKGKYIYFLDGRVVAVQNTPVIQ